MLHSPLTGIFVKVALVFGITGIILSIIIHPAVIFLAIGLILAVLFVFNGIDAGVLSNLSGKEENKNENKDKTKRRKRCC